MTNFERAIKLLFRYEGGYNFRPNDPGGETKYGISKKSYPALDIAQLSPEQASMIYQVDFWDPLNCDALPHPVGLIIFDTAVNCGRDRAARWLQEEINGVLPEPWQLEIDGDIGPLTVTAAKQCDPRQLAMLLLARRQLHYLGLRKQQPQHFAGWIGRITDLMRMAA